MQKRKAKFADKARVEILLQQIVLRIRENLTETHRVRELRKYLMFIIQIIKINLKRRLKKQGTIKRI